MAKKSGTRLIHRGEDFLYDESHNRCAAYSVTQYRKQDTLPDEISLRDEILELKRQLMILKKTNEQYSVKLRKYEDEAKRKDKQLEQLMDPRKNSDITKVLSTKGAAILMNLKDQNNALIQIILNKDLHIRRLMAEIKMSKLYASTKKSESYRAEISRLRNLLIKSQETLKENVDFHEQSRSICVSGNSFLEFSSSSDQSSPRDLDELRLTILNLESHIQQSNDMLAKKNQEILLLKDEINFLKKFSRHKTLKNRFHNCEPTQRKNYEFSTTVTQPEVFIPNKILNEDIFHFFEKGTTNQDDEKQLSPIQDVSKKWITSIDSVPKYNIHSYVSEETTELIETNQENIERVNRTCSLMGKSLFHHLASDEIKREEKILSNIKSTAQVREKWKKALNKYRELKQLNPQMFSGCIQVEKVYIKYDNKETEIKKNPQETDAEDKPDDSNNPVLFLEKGIESITKTLESSHNGDDKASNTCQSLGEEFSILRENNYDTNGNIEETYNEDFQLIKPENPINSQNSGTNEEVESECIKPFQENYFPNIDSDSDSDYSVKQEVQQVQVEVQINSVSSESENDQTGNNISETNQFYEYDRENNGNLAPEHDFNDDDDVIIREK